MKKFNRLLIVILYILLFAILVKLGMFDALINLLMKRTSFGPPYLQVILLFAGLCGVILLWEKLLDDGLEEG